jgi:hypothetical protein
VHLFWTELILVAVATGKIDVVLGNLLLCAEDVDAQVLVRDDIHVLTILQAHPGLGRRLRRFAQLHGALVAFQCSRRHRSWVRWLVDNSGCVHGIAFCWDLGWFRELLRNLLGEELGHLPNAAASFVVAISN